MMDVILVLPENEVMVGPSGLPDRPLGLQLTGEQGYRFQYFTEAEGYWLLHAIQAVLQDLCRSCSLCSREEHEVRAFWASADRTVRICDICVAEAAAEIEAAIGEQDHG